MKGIKITEDNFALMASKLQEELADIIESNVEKIKAEKSAYFMPPVMDEGKAKFPSKDDIVLESLRCINLNKK